MLFAIRQLQHFDTRITLQQLGLQALCIQRCHRDIADNQRQRSLGADGKSLGLRHRAAGNHNGIRAITQIDMNSFGHSG